MQQVSVFVCFAFLFNKVYCRLSGRLGPQKGLVNLVVKIFQPRLLLHRYVAGIYRLSQNPEHDRSVPWSQVSITGPYLKPYECSPQPHILFLYYPLKYYFSKTVFINCSLSSRFLPTRLKINRYNTVPLIA